jgi:CrcB protein
MGPVERFFLISIGAMLGANARYWLGDWAARRWGTSFPFGTLLINLSGSFLLGLFTVLAVERLPVDPRLRILAVVGFLGAYTTFSTYTYESVNLMLQGEWLAGVTNLFGSAILGGAAVLLGVWVGKL